MNQEEIDNLKKLNILYVEDDESIMNLFSEVLKSIFGKVVVASNGQEGLDKFKVQKYKYDFVISDIQMPEMDGLEMIEKIKKIDSAVPCILTTSHGEFDYFMRANEIGVYRYIQKPLDVKDLLLAIKDFQNGLEVKKIDL